MTNFALSEIIETLDTMNPVWGRPSTLRRTSRELNGLTAEQLEELPAFMAQVIDRDEYSFIYEELEWLTATKPAVSFESAEARSEDGIGGVHGLAAVIIGWNLDALVAGDEPVGIEQWRGTAREGYLVELKRASS